MLRKIYLDHFKIIVISVSKRETPTLLTMQPKPLSKLAHFRFVPVTQTVIFFHVVISYHQLSLITSFFVNSHIIWTLYNTTSIVPIDQIE